MISNEELIEKAKEVAKLKDISEHTSIGDVGCALVTDKGNIYLGKSIHTCCGLGFCAEYGAIAAMVTKDEYKIKKIVAIRGNGEIIPPCGRCRQMIFEINEDNLETEFILEKSKTMKLKDLLPEIYNQKKFY